MAQVRTALPRSRLRGADSCSVALCSRCPRRRAAADQAAALSAEASSASWGRTIRTPTGRCKRIRGCAWRVLCKVLRNSPLPQAWSRTANMLFLDSPAFVGFSYSNSSADKKVGDARTASDARLFLLGFLQKFPGFATTPLYIAGESYAGHYVPNLAAAILAGNAAGTGHLNLQGVMIGNAWTDAPTDNLGAAVHWWCVPALWISQLACVAR